MMLQYLLIQELLEVAVGMSPTIKANATKEEGLEEDKKYAPAPVIFAILLGKFIKIYFIMFHSC